MEKFKKILTISEIAFIAILSIGFIANIAIDDAGDTVILIAGVTLFLIYFGLTWALIFKAENKAASIILGFLGGQLLGLSILGITLRMLLNSFGTHLLMVSIFGLAILLIVSTTTLFAKKSIAKPILGFLKRGVPIFVFSIVFFYLFPINMSAIYGYSDERHNLEMLMHGDYNEEEYDNIQNKLDSLKLYEKAN